MHNPKLSHCWVTQCYNKHYILLERVTGLGHFSWFLVWINSLFLIDWRHLCSHRTLIHHCLVLNFFPGSLTSRVTIGIRVVIESKKYISWNMPAHVLELSLFNRLILLDSWELYRLLSPGRFRSRLCSPVLFYPYPPPVVHVLARSKRVVRADAPLFPLGIVASHIHLK